LLLHVSQKILLEINRENLRKICLTKQSLLDIFVTRMMKNNNLLAKVIEEGTVRVLNPVPMTVP
jgi:hypothetical protein